MIKEKIKILNKEKKSAEEITLKIKTLEYSAIKMKANNPALNSTLKPDTSSASPSGKSKGARFVSAKIEMIHGNKIGKKIILAIELIVWRLEKENEFLKRQTVIIKKIILTSYEIIWANLRILPRRAYLELDVQPAIIIK